MSSSSSWTTLSIILIIGLLIAIPGLYLTVPRASGGFTITQRDGKSTTLNIRRCGAGMGPVTGFFGVGLYDSSGSGVLFHDTSLVPNFDPAVLIVKGVSSSSLSFASGDCVQFERRAKWDQGGTYSEHFNKVSGLLEVNCRNKNGEILQGSASFTRCSLKEAGL